MNRFVKTACLVLSLMLPLVSCASSSAVSGRNQAQVALNREQGLPLWAGCSFLSSEAKAYMPGYRNGEKGLYAAGSGTSAAAARVDARAKLAYWCEELYSPQTSLSADTLIGSRAVDSYEAPDGTYHVLMFISEKNARKSFGG